jgi:hypothetical protein
MFKVNLVSQSGFTNSQQTFVKNALKKFEFVMSSKELKNRIINFQSPLNNRFEDNLGLTNEQVLEKIYAAEEIYTIDKDYEADLYLVLVKKRKPLFTRHPAIGYGMPGQKEIFTYSWWFSKATETEYAGHIAHEWAHKVGFDHTFELTPTRKYSVPYVFGDVVEELCKTIIQ